MSVREVKESPTQQGSAEMVPYRFEFDGYGITPESGSAVLLDVTSNTSGSPLLTGSVTIDDNDMISPLVGPLTSEHVYKLTLAAQAGSTILSAFLYIQAEEE